MPKLTSLLCTPAVLGLPGSLIILKTHGRRAEPGLVINVPSLREPIDWKESCQYYRSLKTLLDETYWKYYYLSSFNQTTLIYTKGRSLGRHTGISDMVLNWVKLTRNGTNVDHFKTYFHYILGRFCSSADLNVSAFVQFVANYDITCWEFPICRVSFLEWNIQAKI